MTANSDSESNKIFRFSVGEQFWCNMETEPERKLVRAEGIVLSHYPITYDKKGFEVIKYKVYFPEYEQEYILYDKEMDECR
jgi:hypothetical protein